MFQDEQMVSDVLTKSLPRLKDTVGFNAYIKHKR